MDYEDKWLWEQVTAEDFLMLMPANISSLEATGKYGNPIVLYFDDNHSYLPAFGKRVNNDFFCKETKTWKPTFWRRK
jgi:hypothetical protein